MKGPDSVVLRMEAIAETNEITDVIEEEGSLEGLIEAEDSTQGAEPTQQRPMMHITAHTMLKAIQMDNQEVKVIKIRPEVNQKHMLGTVYLERTIMKMM